MPLISRFPDIQLKRVGNVLEYIFDRSVNPEENAIAFIDGETGETRTFGQIKAETELVAKALDEFGLVKGDVIAMCLPNCLEFMSIVLGGFSRGVLICGLNPAYTRDEYEYHLTDSTAKMIFASKESIGSISQAIRKISGNQAIILVGEFDNPDWTKEAMPYDDFLERGRSGIRPLRPVELNPETDSALMLYSSGTTGKPKGVLLSHSAWAAGIQVTFVRGIHDHPEPGEHLIGMLPMFHMMGLICSMYALRIGFIPVLMRKFEAEKMLQWIEKYRIRRLYCVPPMLVFLAKSTLVDKYDLTSIRNFMPGAAPVGKELYQEVMTRFPHAECLCQGYGLSETGAAVTFEPKFRSKPGSCGMLVPNYQCMVINIETGEECAPHEHGEFWFKGPSIMSGYFRKPQATEDTLKDGWLRTGDIGYYDEDGCFFIVDRLKEMIKVKGFQVAPVELEDLLLSHPDVADAAVVSKPDQMAGEVPKAFVVKKPSSKVTEAELIEFVSEHAASYKRLKGGVEFIDSIPKSPSGKILRRILQQREKEKPSSKL
jgi:acyl-CoA synthetase (AMP-forming)/AMP-acid ligase II